MSNKALSADNQQATLESLHIPRGASETTRQAPITRSEIIAYLNGAIHDASINKGNRIRFAQKNREWLERLQKLLKEINCSSWIYKEGKDRNVFILETLCKDLDFTLNPLELKTLGEKISYMRGFFDAEGGIPHTKDRFYVQLVQKNLVKIERLKMLLLEIDIESGKIHNPSKRVDPNYWRIFISSKHHGKFASLIYSYHPIKAQIIRDRMKI